MSDTMKEYIAEAEKDLLHTYNRYQIVLDKGDGVYLYDIDGKKYLDFVAGIAVFALGYQNKAYNDALKAQIDKVIHTSNYYYNVPAIEAARKIKKVSGMDRVFFTNSGAEAVEGALKLAKRFTGRRRMVACRNAYHGSTHGAMSVMESREFSDAYGPMLPGVDWIRFNEPEDLGRITEETACVLVEPVQGEAGVRIPQEGYLEALRRRCDEVGTLLIFDEIQTGFGRTGEMFAMSKYGVIPDIVCLAKALGGGMPLGAFVSSGRIMECISHDPALGHITTFGGHPVCCAAGLAAMEYIIDEGLLGSVERKGALFETLLGGHPAVEGIRRSGLLLAVELGESRKLYRIMELFKESGILSDWFLFCDTAFRISPPLTITDEEVAEVCRIVVDCLDRL